MAYDKRIEICLCDITSLKVDAIVNAANKTLLGGGGVDGAIHRAAGSALLKACHRLNGCRTGEAKITPGFKLPVRYIIHTVGPVWSGGNRDEAAMLASCYRNSLELARKNKLKSIAFPAISTGIYGYPLPAAARIAVEEVNHFLLQDASLERIVFVCFDHFTFDIYNKILTT
ncbi:MAG: O-acetyl-ADP-ribose deacetylase [Candidatus Cloacimonetes bacterium]|nr:O-acetyl-ADP-ribose deacetylase [Candidatus Cloacimonadota bacterium]